MYCLCQPATYFGPRFRICTLSFYQCVIRTHLFIRLQVYVILTTDSLVKYHAFLTVQTRNVQLCVGCGRAFKYFFVRDTGFAAMYIRSAIVWHFTQHRLVIPFRRVGTYRCRWDWQVVPKRRYEITTQRSVKLQTRADLHHFARFVNPCIWKVYYSLTRGPFNIIRFGITFSTAPNFVLPSCCYSYEILKNRVTRRHFLCHFIVLIARGHLYSNVHPLHARLESYISQIIYTSRCKESRLTRW
jgi:hypothetical protein